MTSSSCLGLGAGHGRRAPGHDQHGRNRTVLDELFRDRRVADAAEVLDGGAADEGRLRADLAIAKERVPELELLVARDE